MYELTYLDAVTPEVGAELVFGDASHAAGLYEAIAAGELAGFLIGRTVFTRVRDINVWRGAPTGVLGVKGVVYIVGFGPYIKIGFTSKKSKNRIRDLGNGCPEPLITYGLLEGTIGRERELHKRFKHLRLRGEWFKKEGSLLDWINSGLNF